MSKPTKKETARLKALIQKELIKWKPLMGLAPWRVNTFYYRANKDAPKAHRQTKKQRGARMWMDVDYEYLRAGMNVMLPACIGVDKDELRENVRHELAHAVVNEMRQWRAGPVVHCMEHEERVVSTLAPAFLWTYNAGWNAGRKDLRKQQAKDQKKKKE